MERHLERSDSINAGCQAHSEKQSNGLRFPFLLVYSKVQRHAPIMMQATLQQVLTS